MRGKETNESNSIAADQAQQELQAGVDYYLENGLFVFTAAYLLKRGYCCERGCRHCPYEKLNEK